MVYLVISTLCFSLSFGLIKSNLSILPSELVAFLRLLVASIIFLPFIRMLSIRKHFTALLIGSIQFGIMYLCFIHAFKYLQGNEVAILTTSTPIFVLIWSSIFGERFRIVYIICIFLSIIGAGIIIWENTSFNFILKGILLMETSNCSFALGQVLWKKYIGDTNSIKVMSSAFMGATILTGVMSIIYFPKYPVMLNSPQIFSILYLAIIPTGIGFWLWNRGSTKVSSSMLAIMNNLKIPVASFVAIILFQEKINISNFLVGSLIIISSILILQCINKKQDELK